MQVTNETEIEYPALDDVLTDKIKMDFMVLEKTALDRWIKGFYDVEDIKKCFSGRSYQKTF